MKQPNKDLWSPQNEIFWQTDYYTSEAFLHSEEEEEILQQEDWHEPDITEQVEVLYQEE